MTNELVTVAVAIYNTEKYLRQCIDSIIYQKHHNLEIILVNDGSTDSSPKICESYTYDRRVRVINQINGGLSNARQTCINHANGKYICMIDADDELSENYVERLYSAIESMGADICTCGRIEFSENTETTINLRPGILPKYNIKKQDIEKGYVSLIGDYWMYDTWGKIYLLDFLKKTKVRFTLENKYNGTDLLYNFRLLLHCPVMAVIKEPLYRHRRVENSRVRRKDKQMQAGFMEICEQIIEETNLCGYGETINPHLTALYYKLMRMAAQDIVNYEAGAYSRLKTFFKNHNNFVKKYRQVNAKLQSYNTKSLMLFAMFLKMNCRLSLCGYLYLRKKASLEK